MDFKQIYTKDDFVKFLKGFLPDDFEVDQEELTSDHSFKFVEKVAKLGECKSLDLKIYEIDHKSENDPRVTLSKEAFRLMRSYASRRSLIIFKNPKTRNYRLSLITFQTSWDEGKKIKTEYSNPRRFSFYLGPDARTKTPEKFLKNKVSDFLDLVSRFDVEVVTKEFFAQYKKLYLNLLEQLDSDHAFRAFAHKHSIQLDIFTKKILGQIVFIYFLQRKGWMGAQKGEHISKGDKNFLRTLFEKSKATGQSYFNEYLEPIFYDCLNKKPEMAASFYRERFESQIPFLNGGLFEPLNNYNWEIEFIHIPNELFSNKNKNGILDIFDLYNFTIDENTPDDQEVSVDPEMLGKVFENLIEENIRKGQGAFYTPREIVHYMCQESLLNYLIATSNISEKSIRNYFNLINQNNETAKAAAMFEGEAVEIDDLLKNIKVCDPACGSGAFLIGMLNEIIKLRILMRIFHPNKFEKRSIYQLKKETIQNSLYGVDIDPGAIDIAKLRFWLAIVVDEDIDEIEPLPNLDYKLMQGNSLLEDLVVGDSVISFNFDGNHKFDRRTKDMKNLFEAETQAKLFLDKSETLAEKLEKLHTEYFNVHDIDKKKVLKRKIDSVEDELIKSKCQEEIKNTESQIKNSIDQKKVLKGTQKLLAIKDVLNKWEKDRLRPFFPWKLHFGEVFNRENSGFDIIIANPPYVDSETMVRSDKKQRDEYCNIFSCARGNWDLFVIFIEKGLLLLNISGTISYIVPNKLIASNYTSTIRELLNSKKMIEIRDYSEIKVFKEVNVYPVVFIAQNVGPGGTVAMTHMEGMESKKHTNYISDEVFYKDIFWDKYFVDKKILDLILKISSNANLDEYFHEISSAATVSEAYRFKEYIHELDSKNTNFKKLINTGTIDPFVSLWGRQKTQYIKDSFIRPVIENDFIFKVNATRLKQASAEKIIVGGMTKRIECVYDKGQYLAGKSTTVIYGNEKIDLRALVCILNSKMISFWYKVYFNSLSLAGGYLQIGSATVKKIPLALTVGNNQTKLTELHDLITDLTKSDNYLNDLVKQTKVEEYKDQVDQMVYKLYDLTPEEVKIVEAQ